MGPPPVITLLTDYGLTDEFVGVVHGVIAKICPAARVIDLTHGIRRGDIRSGAGILAQSLPYTPIGIHVAVVDPTVGGERLALALRAADDRILIGPDNGLLWLAGETAGGITEAVEISDSRWCLRPVSPTFHGRDIFTPVAANLAAGGSLHEAGQSLDPSRIVQLNLPRAWIEAGSLVAQVSNGDRFGNAQLNATRDDAASLDLQIADSVQVAIPTGESYIAQFARTFSDVPEGTLILFEDSARRLALGFNQGSATGRLSLRIGDEVRISRADASDDDTAVVRALRSNQPR
jgi:S-adenosyl-L-methionine hydrolase (adenosine-forming)